MWIAITPKTVGNILMVEALGFAAHSAISRPKCYIATSGGSVGGPALAAAAPFRGANATQAMFYVVASVTVSSVASQSYSFWLGDSGAGTNTFNGEGGVGIGARQLGSYMKIMEFTP